VLPLANDRVEISAGAGIGSYQLDVEIKDPPPPPVNRTESRSETADTLGKTLWGRCYLRCKTLDSVVESR